MALQGETRETEPWYGTEYSQEAIPAAWLDSWRDAAAPEGLHLPLPNPFISSDFTLINVALLPFPGSCAQFTRQQTCIAIACMPAPHR